MQVSEVSSFKAVLIYGQKLTQALLKLIFDSLQIVQYGKLVDLSVQGRSRPLYLAARTVWHILNSTLTGVSVPTLHRPQSGV